MSNWPESGEFVARTNIKMWYTIKLAQMQRQTRVQILEVTQNVYTFGNLTDINLSTESPAVWRMETRSIVRTNSAAWKSRRQKDQRVGWLLWGDRRPLNWWCILPSSWRLFSIYETKRSQLRLGWLSKSQRRSRWARSVHAFSTLVLPKIWNLCFPIQRKHWRYWRKNSRALKKNLSNLKRNSWYYGDIHNTAT